MEDTLRVTVEEFKAEMNWVLILVVMEDTLRVQTIKLNTTNPES